MQLCLFVATSAAALASFALRAARRRSILEVYAVCYAGLVLIQPTASAWQRYLVPVLPLWFLYVALAPGELARRGTAARGRAASVALASLLVLAYGRSYFTAHFGPLPGGWASPSVQEALAHVRTSCPRMRSSVFRDPRTLTLLTGRPRCPHPRDPLLLLAAQPRRRVGLPLLRGCHPPLAAPRAAEDLRYNMKVWSDLEFIEQFAGPVERHLETIFENEDFRLQRLTPPFRFRETWGRCLRGGDVEPSS